MITHSKPTIGKKDHLAITSMLNKLQLAHGAAAKLFTEELTNFTGAGGGVLTSSGSEAQMALMLSLGIKEGDEVILPTYVCKSVYEAILAVNATPVLCDIGSNWMMNYETVSACLTNKTAAVIIVHIFGFDAWDNRFTELGVPIIEDFCQAFGLQSRRSINNQGLASFYSFQATKCITTGEGGFAATNDKSLFNKLRIITGSGIIKTRFSDIQAVLGLSQLEQYPSFLDRRRQIARRYLQELSPVCIAEELRTEIQNSVLFRFPIKLLPEQVLGLVSFMENEEVAVRRGVDKMLHNLYTCTDSSFFATAEAVFARTICLPIYPSLTDDEQSIIINGVNNYLSKVYNE